MVLLLLWLSVASEEGKVTMYAVMFYAPSTHVELERYRTRTVARRYLTKDMNKCIRELGFELVSKDKDSAVLMAPYGKVEYRIVEK